MKASEMRSPPSWWQRPRRIRVVVDNDSWILTYAERFVGLCNGAGDDAVLCRSHDDIADGDVCFYLGCVKISPPDVLARCRRNLVVHESDLPADRGFSPLTWQILEGQNEIPICLFEAAQATDAGPVIYRDVMRFQGTELIDRLRAVQGEVTLGLCMRFLESPHPSTGEPQSGKPTYRSRRTPKDSELDPYKSLAEQFDLLRIVDNERYPAYFAYRGRHYTIKVFAGPDASSEK